jgi:hypothetical protein
MNCCNPRGCDGFFTPRFMDTSVEEIDRTYGHLLPDALDRTRAALDAFVATTEVTATPEARRQ